MFPIRRRFKVNSPSVEWGHQCYAALPHVREAPRKLHEALPDATMWGHVQLGVGDDLPSDQSPPAFIWVWPLPNPEPERNLKALRLKPASEEPLMVCGLTLYHGKENPLRLAPLHVYRITVPEPTASEPGRWSLGVDLGVVARSYTLNDFDAESWLAAPGKGLGERRRPTRSRYLYADIAANAGATLTLTDTKNGGQFQFDLGQAALGQEVAARAGAAHIEILDPHKVWLHGRAVDSATGKPTPVRLAFRTAQGRYIPPYGHRTEINNAWFQDYGADLMMMDTPFAYVDGTFQVELPVGEIFVEMTKGFEYSPVRRKVQIAPGQREMKLEIGRFADLRKEGWITADTHVHFLSPSTAVLEGQAEGLNLINLLAAQWGDLFTNVGDLPQGPIASHDGETMVWPGTENRQHILGHLCLLGGHGEPVFPMSAAGPDESYLGDPLWTSLADWLDACRKRGGLAVTAHVPYPIAAVGADMAVGKSDALEIYPDFGTGFDNPRFIHWYHALSCGYRLPVVGGTDKMGAYMAVGANRTYACLGQNEFSFANWAQAVRKSNTFMTSGPLLTLRADGRVPGDVITLGAGGGKVEVETSAQCFVPLHRIEIVMNGRIAASHEEPNGAHQLKLHEQLQVPGPAWIAARCLSTLGPTTDWHFKVLAHTSPVYLDVPGQEVFSAPAAAFLMTLIEGAETWVNNLATPSDPESMARIRQTYREARQRLHHKMHAHGLAH